jgi:hypothetical protein
MNRRYIVLDTNCLLQILGIHMLSDIPFPNIRVKHLDDFSKEFE